MAKFRGVYPTTIDGKGRTSFPARFREILVESFGDDRFFLTNSSPVDLGGGIHSSGLLIFPHRSFALFEEKFQDSKGLTPAQRESIINIVINPAIELSADKLGRFLVPPHLRRNASLERDILFVAAMDKIKIWSQTEWEKVLAQNIRNFPSGSEAAAELGL
ncbi:MAG TPA: division/cell wall cluster transcriptional repressor MraZ [Geobacteraceae bacterium]|nr:division/cell wall cluster transcriptional repressor MraZ [Geobacteraceae bacterium]